MTSKPVVFIVDDDPAARDSVAALVQSKDQAWEAFASAEEFLASFQEPRPGCLVVDIRMEGMSGLELLEALKQRQIRLPVIIITGYGDVPTAVEAMKAGAFTFLEKPCHANDLWAAITKALDEVQHEQREQARIDEIKARVAQLTPDELRILHGLVAGKSNKQLALELDLGLRTVELRRANVLKKMQTDSLAELVRLALLAGEVQ